MTEYTMHLVTPETMNQILNWMYCHKMGLTDESVPEILKTAHYLDCSEIVFQCTKYLMRKLTAENILGFWNFAKEYQIKELEDQFMSFLTYHFAVVVRGEEFMELTDENLNLLLKREDLNADEETVLRSLMAW